MLSQISQLLKYSVISSNMHVIFPYSPGLGLGLWCLTSLSTIFQLYRGGQFYWWRKPEDPEKTTDLPLSLTHLSHNVVSSTPRPVRDSNSVDI